MHLVVFSLFEEATLAHLKLTPCYSILYFHSCLSQICLCFILNCFSDVSAPVFADCPANIVITADRDETSAQVTWVHPTCTDNSGLVPNITQFGKQPGNTFSVGEHNIRYLASDRSGNIAECRFKIFVQGKCFSKWADVTMIPDMVKIVSPVVCYVLIITKILNLKS